MIMTPSLEKFIQDENIDKEELGEEILIAFELLGKENRELGENGDANDLHWSKPRIEEVLQKIKIGPYFK